MSNNAAKDSPKPEEMVEFMTYNEMVRSFTFESRNSKCQGVPSKGIEGSTNVISAI